MFGDTSMRSLLLSLLALSLLAAAPAAAGGPTLLHARGEIVALDEEWIGVKSADGMLRCRIPDRLVDKAETLALGDRIWIVCSKRGKRAPELQAIKHAAADEKKPDEKKHEKTGHEQALAGTVKSVSDDSITVADGDRALKCVVPAAKADRLDGVEVGDRVKLVCKGGDLVHLGRASSDAPAVHAVDIAGLVTAVSDVSITVASTDKSRSLTCSVPLRLAETVYGLSVGDAVKLLCKKSDAATELAAVARLVIGDKQKEKPKTEWTIAGAITSHSGDRIVVSAEGRSLSCFIPQDWREKLAGFAVGDRVKMLCRGADERSAAVATFARL